MRALRPRTDDVCYTEDPIELDLTEEEPKKQKLLRFAFKGKDGSKKSAEPRPRGARQGSGGDADEDGQEAPAPRRSSKRAAAAEATLRMQEQGQSDDDEQGTGARKPKPASKVAARRDDGTDEEGEDDESEPIETSEDEAEGGNQARGTVGPGAKTGRKGGKQRQVAPAGSGRPRRQAQKPAIVEEDDDEEDGGVSSSGASEDSLAGAGGEEEEEGSEGSSEGGEDAEDEEEEEEEDSVPVRRSARERGKRPIVVIDSDSEGEDGDSPGSSSDGAEEERRVKRRGKGRSTRSSADDVEVVEIEVEGEEEAGAAAATAPRAPAKPPTRGVIERIVRRDEQDGNKFVVKFKGHSYRRLGVLSVKQIENQNKGQLLKSFLAKGADLEIPEDWTTVERAIASRPIKGKMQYLVKWKDLDYSDSTWEQAEELTERDIADFNARSKPNKAKPVARQDLVSHEEFAMPEFGSGRRLRDYQEQSVRWMVSNFRNKLNCILGDEMGLGKTAQSIGALECLRRLDGVSGPFLLVAPLTTLGHWRREIQTWTDMNVVLYAGSADDRAVIQDYELFHQRSAGPRCFARENVKVQALLVSYEMLLKDKSFFNKFSFAAAIFDEAHKLKGINSATRAVVVGLDIDWKLLLTGTPIQNNLSELFSILNLLDPHMHHDEDEFSDKYGDGSAGSTTETAVKELQEVLRPILLRRMKEDVETLPEKEEIIVWVQLTEQQRHYYEALYAKQIGALLGGASNKNLPNMRNLAMELRKLCNHPFLCNGLEEDMSMRRALARSLPDGSQREMLERASGKMVLLGKLLPKLKEQGKRVLIFSQFKIMLDVLEDWIHEHKWPVERIDGSITGRDRQAAIDRYTNGTSENSFIFLLSTRAGGQGITLTVADTCIIYDSDWNPQNDLQAMARCHRIGQDKDVTVYRLVSKDTYEEQLFNTASRKYGLDEAILGFSSSTDPEADTGRIAQLLRHGAHSLAAPEANQQGEAFQSEDIDQILASRTEKRVVGGKAGNTFSVATFAVCEEPAQGEAAAARGPGRPSAAAVAAGDAYWESLMPEAVKAYKDNQAKQRAGPVMDGPRSRRRVNYKTCESDHESNPDSDFSGGGEDGEEDDGTAQGGGKDKADKKKKKDKGEKARVWLRNDLRAVEDKLLLLGKGRWQEIHEQLSLPAVSLEELRGVGETLEAAWELASNQTARKRAEDKAERAEQKNAARLQVLGLPAPPAAARQPVNFEAEMSQLVRGKCPAPALAALLHDAKYLLRNGPDLHKQLSEMTAFVAAVRKAEAAEAAAGPTVSDGVLELSELVTVVVPAAAAPSGAAQRKRSPVDVALPAPGLDLPTWWSAEQDGQLLWGMLKHGLGRKDGLKRAVEIILSDLDLELADRVAPAPEGWMVEAAEAQQGGGDGGGPQLLPPSEWKALTAAVRKRAAMLLRAAIDPTYAELVRPGGKQHGGAGGKGGNKRPAAPAAATAASKAPLPLSLSAGPTLAAAPSQVLNRPLTVGGAGPSAAAAAAATTADRAPVAAGGAPKRPREDDAAAAGNGQPDGSTDGAPPAKKHSPGPAPGGASSAAAAAAPSAVNRVSLAGGKPAAPAAAAAGSKPANGKGSSGKMRQSTIPFPKVSPAPASAGASGSKHALQADAGAGAAAAAARPVESEAKRLREDAGGAAGGGSAGAQAGPSSAAVPDVVVLD